MGDGADDAYDIAMRDEWEHTINKIWKKEIFKKMSYTMEGKILGISKDTIKNGPNAGKTYYKINVEDLEGERIPMTAWEYSSIENINVGDNAEIEFGVSKDGKFKHITNSVKITQVGEKSEPNSYTQKTIETPAPAQRRVYDPKTKTLDEGCYIHRTSALYNAVEYLKNNPDATIADVIGTADRFVAFIESGE